MKRLLFIFSFFFLQTAAVQAQNPPLEADLIAMKSGISPAEETYLALRIKLDKGWHTYWRNSGDAGEPVDLTLNLPEGFKETGRYWPHPSRFSSAGIAEYGYGGGEIVIPVGIKAPDDLAPNRKWEITGSAVWMACKNECVPGKTDFSLYLTSGMKDDSENASLKEGLSKIPERLSTPLAYRDEGGAVVLELPRIAGRFSSAYFFPDSPRIIDHGADQKLKKAEGRIFLFMAGRGRAVTGAISGTLVFYDLKGTAVKALEVRAEASETPFPEFALPFLWTDFIGALMLAFAGGFLLNLMPCVFPVLSLKAYKVLSAASKNESHLKKESLIYSAGVLVSFAVLGGVLLALRKAGTELGWGFQLQFPPFVLILSVFLFVLGLLFSDAASFGENIAAKGASVGARWSDFGTGVLAVFVATPCAAPFMGTALGYGMTSPAPVTMAVFVVMGAGMALPFLVLGFFPKAARFLPKAGSWMVLFRRFLAFPLYGAAGWLLWVLSVQGGSFALACGIVCLSAAGFSVWLYGESQTYPRLKNWARAAFAGFAVLICFSACSVSPAHQKLKEESAIPWRPFDMREIERFQGLNVPVFVKFSASWCLTCLLNDNAVLDKPETAELFRSKGIAAFYGDWTERDDRITRVLESFGRGGIPLYVYYPPESGKPVVFSQILTFSALREAFSGL